MKDTKGKICLEKLNKVAALLQETKADLDKVMDIEKEIRQGKVWAIKPICKQGELFSFLPEENETLARLCLSTLVETL
jgi:hypothetical protein